METIKLNGNRVFETIEDLIYFYFNNRNPSTYSPDSGEIQCVNGRRRSVKDMTMLVNYYFPDTLEEKVINVINKIGLSRFEDNIILCHICEEVGNFVFNPAYYTKDDFKFIDDTILTNYNYEGRSYSLDHKPKNSEYTLKDIVEIFKRNDL